MSIDFKLKSNMIFKAWLFVLTCEAKVVCLMKIWWSFLNYLEAIIIGIKPTLMKIKRFDGIHDLMVFMLIKFGTCVLHMDKSLRKSTWCLYSHCRPCSINL